jgi:hypothetical protein
MRLLRRMGYYIERSQRKKSLPESRWRHSINKENRAVSRYNKNAAEKLRCEVLPGICAEPGSWRLTGGVN